MAVWKWGEVLGHLEAEWSQLPQHRWSQPAGDPHTYSPAWPAFRPLRDDHRKQVRKNQQSGNKGRRRWSWELYLGKLQTLPGQTVWPAESEEHSGPHETVSLSKRGSALGPCHRSGLKDCTSLHLMHNNPNSMINSGHIIRREERSRYILQLLYPF